MIEQSSTEAPDRLTQTMIILKTLASLSNMLQQAQVTHKVSYEYIGGGYRGAGMCAHISVTSGVSQRGLMLSQPSSNEGPLITAYINDRIRVMSHPISEADLEKAVAWVSYKMDFRF